MNRFVVELTVLILLGTRGNYLLAYEYWMTFFVHSEVFAQVVFGAPIYDQIMLHDLFTPGNNLLNFMYSKFKPPGPLWNR